MNMKYERATDVMREQERKSSAPHEIEYWRPLTEFITDALQERARTGLSQSDLGKLMATKQSVISRFENMGRKPNYDFMMRLSQALGDVMGLTLHGNFMAVVKSAQRSQIEEIAASRGIQTREMVQSLLDGAVEEQLLVADTVRAPAKKL